MTQIAAAITAIIGFLKTLLGLQERRRQQQAGVQAQAATQREQVIETVDQVHAAQVAAERDHVRNPGSVLEDDGFRRD